MKKIDSITHIEITHKFGTSLLTCFNDTQAVADRANSNARFEFNGRTFMVAPGDTINTWAISNETRAKLRKLKALAELTPQFMN